MKRVQIKDFNEMTRNDMNAQGVEVPLNVNKLADRAYYICYIIETVDKAFNNDNITDCFQSWKREF